VTRTETSRVWFYGLAVVAAAVAVGLRLLLDPLWGPRHPFILYFPAVMLSGWFGGFGPGALTTLLSTAAAALLWLPPPPPAQVMDLGDPIGLGMFVAVGLLISGLNEARLRSQERLQAATASLRQSHERLGAMLESTSEGFLAFDRQWRCVHVNEQAALMAGRSRGQMIGHTAWELFPDLVGTAAEAEVRRAAREGVPVRLEHFHALGQQWFEARVAPAGGEGVTVFFRDVTASRRAEDERAALLGREQAARLEAEVQHRQAEMLAGLAQAINESLERDVLLQRVADATRRACDSDAAAIALPTRDGAMAIRYRSGTEPAVERGPARIEAGHGVGGRVLQTGKPFRPGAGGHGTPSGDNHVSGIGPEEVAAMAAPILIEGRVEGLLLAQNDAAPEAASGRLFSARDEAVLERVAALAAVALRNAQLYEREQQLRADAEGASRAKDEFLAMLGHELRNPLGAIGTAAAVLAQSGRFEARDARAVEIIGRQVKHLAAIVDDLLDVSRVMTGKILLDRQATELSEVVERALATAAPATMREQYRVLVQSEPVWVDGDPTRIEQIASNLLSNAFKYTPAPGTIRVEASRDGDRAMLRVEDSGIGISAELLPHIFDLFVQGEHGLDRAHGGLGIGLTLTRRLVELHGGRVTAHSEGPGRGSCFIVELPARPRPTEPPGTRAPAEGEAGPRRILVIEDNADAREMLRRLLGMAGHLVEEAADGVDGVVLALKRPPDVVLIDLGLPGLDGYEVARRIRALGKHDRPYLVALTGYGLPEDRRRSREAGFDAHLVKPVDADQLMQLIRQA
jgi:PAS domain S-box-containing protein